MSFLTCHCGSDLCDGSFLEVVCFCDVEGSKALHNPLLASDFLRNRIADATQVTICEFGSSSGPDMYIFNQCKHVSCDFQIDPTLFLFIAGGVSVTAV